MSQELFLSRVNGPPSTANVGNPIGRVTNPGWMMVYSPNSSRAVNVPSAPQGVPPPQVDARKCDVIPYYEPIWFSASTLYLAFLPLAPRYIGIPFQELMEVSFIRSKDGWALPADTIESWRGIEKTLRRIITTFSKRYVIPEPAVVVVGNVITCDGVFKELRALKQELRRTRGWFKFYIASLSFSIACAQSFDQDALSRDKLPKWFRDMKTEFDEILLSGIHSDAGTFSPEFSRAGVFIDLQSPTFSQVPLDLLLRCHIPVYYRWEVDWVKNPRLARFAPLPHQLQRVTAIVDQSPSSLPLPPQSTPVDNKPWVAFLDRRKQKVAALISNENPRQKQARLDRTRNPPQENTHVFVWEVDADGVYQRVSVPKRERRETLEEYGVNQKLYCPVLNEWDCGEGFGPLTAEEQAGRDDSDEDFLPSWPRVDPLRANSLAPLVPAVGNDAPVANPLPPLPAPVHHAHTRPDDAQESRIWNPPTNMPDSQHIFELDVLHHTEYLYRFLGLLLPNHIVSHPSPIPLTTSLYKQFAAVSGEQVCSISDESLLQYCLEFLRGFGEGKSPPEKLYDLANTNHPLDLRHKNARLLSIHRHQEFGFYFVLPPSHTHLPFYLAVANALAALFVCRLPPAWSDVEICRQLIQSGIRFQTFLTRPKIPRRAIPALPIPIRSSSYQFSRTDYQGYLQEREALLRDPRVRRAALMKGGIIWRLVVSEVPFDEVYLGPTSAATQGQGFVVEGHATGTILCDDELTPSEADVLCGLVYQYTAHGDQRQEKSWWPRYQLWSKLAVHPGWNSAIEKVFRKRLDELIDSKDPQPLNASEWRKRINADTASSRTFKYAALNSKAFLDTIHPPP